MYGLPFGEDSFASLPPIIDDDTIKLRAEKYIFALFWGRLEPPQQPQQFEGQHRHLYSMPPLLPFIHMRVGRQALTSGVQTGRERPPRGGEGGLEKLTVNINASSKKIMGSCGLREQHGRLEVQGYGTNGQH
jgi:hypothetical protein